MPLTTIEPSSVSSTSSATNSSSAAGDAMENEGRAMADRKAEFGRLRTIVMVNSSSTRAS